MHGIAAHTLAGRFAWFFDELCKAVGVDAQKRRMEAALAWAVWNRVRLLGERLIALALRVRSGRLRGRKKVAPHPDLPPQGGDYPGLDTGVPLHYVFGCQPQGCLR